MFINESKLLEAGKMYCLREGTEKWAIKAGYKGKVKFIAWYYTVNYDY